MKNLIRISILIFLMTFMGGDLFGQITKGTFRLGPGFNYGRSTTNLANQKLIATSYTLEIAGAYYIIDNLELGLAFNHSSAKSEFATIANVSTSGNYFGALMAYMVPLSSGFYIPIAGSVGRGTINSDTLISGNSSSGLTWQIGSGIEYIVANRIGARLGLNYISNNLNDGDIDFKNTGFQTLIMLNFYFGK